jgi:hypothetical protein
MASLLVKLYLVMFSDRAGRWEMVMYLWDVAVASITTTALGINSVVQELSLYK